MKVYRLKKPITPKEQQLLDKIMKDENTRERARKAVEDYLKATEKISETIKRQADSLRELADIEQSRRDLAKAGDQSGPITAKEIEDDRKMSGSVRGLEFTAELKEAMSGVRDEQVKLNAEAYKDAQKAAADYGSKLAGFRRGTVTAEELRESATAAQRAEVYMSRGSDRISAIDDTASQFAKLDLSSLDSMDDILDGLRALPKDAADSIGDVIQKRTTQDAQELARMIQRTESASDAMQREVEARTNKTEKTALESRDEQERLESARRNLGKFGEMDLSYALQFAEQNQNTTFREETFRDALSKSSGLLTRKQTDELSQTYDVNALRSALEDNAKFDDKEKESIDKQLDLVARERQNVADQRLRLTEQRDALVQEKEQLLQIMDEIAAIRRRQLSNN